MSGETPAPVSRLLADVSAAVGAVGKDSTAPSQIGGYRFRGVDAVVNAVSPHLARAGILMVPEVLDVHREIAQSGGGRAMKVVTVTTRFTFHGPAGDSVAVVTLGEASDSGDKATSKAQSVALRVALLQALLLPTDEPDPDETNFERRAPGPQQQAQPPRGRRPDVGGQASKPATPPAGPTTPADPSPPEGAPAGHAPAAGSSEWPEPRGVQPDPPGPDPKREAAQKLAWKALAKRTEDTLRKVYLEAREEELLGVLVQNADESWTQLHALISAKLETIKAGAEK